MKKEGFAVTLLLLMMFQLFSSAQSATTGKIAGKVVDRETGEPLIGANVIIAGTQYGAAADANGDFYILNIPPGRYTLTARMMGYSPVQMENVQVRTNATTTLDFSLPSTVIEGETIVVTVDAIATKKDQTSSIRNVSSEQISVLPVESMQQVVELQAGVVDGHFRGGRSNEVAYMIDGLQINDVFNNSRLTEVENEVIQDIEVILGTFNAEYGGAMSGVVNVVTKDGGASFDGSISGQLGNYFTARDDIFLGLEPGELDRKTNLRLQLSGPILKRTLSFLVNYRQRNEQNHLNGIHRFNPGDYSDFTSTDPSDWYSEHSGDGSYVPMSTHEGYTLFSKLTFKPTANLKASLVWNRNQSDNGWYSHWMKYNPYGVAQNHSSSDGFTFLLNHMLSQSLFHEFKVNILNDESRSYVYEDPRDPRYVSDWYGLSFGPGFSTGSQDFTHNTHKTRKLDVKYDVTWQVNSNHSLKAGFVATRHDKDIQEYTVVNRLRNSAVSTWTDTLYNDLGDITKISYPYFEPDILDDTTAYANVYRKKPSEFAAYFQDKMEFQDLVLNLGVRYDRFDPATVYPSNLRNPGNQLNFLENPERMSDYADAEVQQQVSPRFGLAYTLGDQAKLHFSYGHFFQMPDAYALYTNHNFRIASGNFSTMLGNPQLKAEKSVKYEVGLWQEIIQGLGINVALYYADVYNLLSTAIITTYNQTKYGLYTNKDYGNRKGLEVGLEWNLREFFTSLNYTLQYTRGNADNPSQTFTRAGQSMDPIPRLITLSWDQRHTLNLSVGYQKRNYGATLTGYYNSGKPYTWEPLPESRLAFVNLYPNNSWKPSTFSLDLHGRYDVPLSRNYGLRFTLLVYNLLDTQNEINVNSTTGRANQEIVREVDLVRHRSDFNDYQDQINNPANFSAPREIKLGIGLTF